MLKLSADVQFEDAPLRRLAPRLQSPAWRVLLTLTLLTLKLLSLSLVPSYSSTSTHTHTHTTERTIEDDLHRSSVTSVCLLHFGLRLLAVVKDLLDRAAGLLKVREVRVDALQALHLVALD